MSGRYEGSDNGNFKLSALDSDFQAQFSNQSGNDEIDYRKIFSVPKDSENGVVSIGGKNRLTFGGNDIYGSSELTGFTPDAQSGTRHFSGHSTFSFGKGSVGQPDLTDEGNTVPAGDRFISSADDFDSLNLNKDNNPGDDTLSRNELSHGAVNRMFSADSNANGRLEKDEWMGVSTQFGFGKEGAAHAYAESDKDGSEGLSLNEAGALADRHITPGLLSADSSQDEKLSRTEFKSLLDGPLEPVYPGDKPASPTDQTPGSQIEQLQKQLEQLQEMLSRLLEWLKNYGKGDQPLPAPSPEEPEPAPDPAYPDSPLPKPGPEPSPSPGTNPDAGGSTADLFDHWNKNGDGELQHGEVIAGVSDFLSKKDTNHDGQLDGAELKEVLKPGSYISRVFAAVDNGDGKMDAAERSLLSQEMGNVALEVYDTSRDPGKDHLGPEDMGLSRQEFAKFAAENGLK